MKRIVQTTFLLVLSIHAITQIDKRDSLLKLLPSAKEDTTKVMLLLRLADVYETNNQDSSRYYLEEAKRLSDVLKFDRGLYHYYEQAMIVSFTKGNYDSSVEQGNQALALAKKMKDSGYIVIILVNTGILYQYLGQFDKQLEYTLQALELLEKRNEKGKLSGTYQNIANAYFNLQQYKKALDYSFLSLKLHLQTKSNNYPNRIYASIGQNYAMMKNTDSALYYFKIAIAESISTNDKYAEAAIYGYMADTYANRDDYKEMLKVSQKSLELSRVLQSNQMLASAMYTLAYAHYLNGDNIAARKKH